MNREVVYQNVTAPISREIHFLCLEQPHTDTHAHAKAPSSLLGVFACQTLIQAILP